MQPKIMRFFFLLTKSQVIFVLFTLLASCCLARLLLLEDSFPGTNLIEFIKFVSEISLAECFFLLRLLVILIKMFCLGSTFEARGVL